MTDPQTSLLAALDRISTFNTIDELLDAFKEAEEAMREMEGIWEAKLQ